MRRGSLEWNLMTIGQLVFGAAMLIMLIAISVAIVAIFTDGEKTWRAYRNLDLLERKIALHEDETEWSDTIILQMPDTYVLISFTDKKIPITNTEWKNKDQTLEKPAFCGDVCICVFQATTDDAKPIKKIACKKLKTEGNAIPLGVEKEVKATFASTTVIRTDVELINNGQSYAVNPKTGPQSSGWYSFMFGIDKAPTILTIRKEGSYLFMSTGNRCSTVKDKEGAEGKDLPQSPCIGLVPGSRLSIPDGAGSVIMHHCKQASGDVCIDVLSQPNIRTTI